MQDMDGDQLLAGRGSLDTERDVGARRSSGASCRWRRCAPSGLQRFAKKGGRAGGAPRPGGGGPEMLEAE